MPQIAQASVSDGRWSRRPARSATNGHRRDGQRVAQRSASAFQRVQLDDGNRGSALLRLGAPLAVGLFIQKQPSAARHPLVVAECWVAQLRQWGKAAGRLSIDRRGD